MLIWLYNLKYYDFCFIYINPLNIKICHLITNLNLGNINYLVLKCLNVCLLISFYFLVIGFVLQPEGPIFVQNTQLLFLIKWFHSSLGDTTKIYSIRLYILSLLVYLKKILLFDTTIFNPLFSYKYFILDILQIN